MYIYINTSHLKNQQLVRANRHLWGPRFPKAVESSETKEFADPMDHDSAKNLATSGVPNDALSNVCVCM